MKKEKSEAQKYLERVKKLDCIIRNKLIERKQWEDLAHSITANMGSEKVQSSGSKSKMSDAADKCMDAESEIDAAVEKLVKEKREIVSIIEQVESPIEYNVLHLRFIQYKDLLDIADHYHKSYDWAKTTNGRAIASVKRILDKKGENA